MAGEKSVEQELAEANATITKIAPKLLQSINAIEELQRTIDDTMVGLVVTVAALAKISCETPEKLQIVRDTVKATMRAHGTLTDKNEELLDNIFSNKQKRFSVIAGKS